VRLDGHIHVMGNGRSGSGCWYRPRGFTRLAEPVLLRAMGLPGDAMERDFETLYERVLLDTLRGSGLDGAVILAHEEAYREDGTRLVDTGSFYVPNDYVLGLARRYPQLRAAVAIHPARRDAREELDRCVQAGAVMLKCLPNCQNIDWNLRAYRPFLERMAETGMILLAHTGSERTMPVLRPDLASPRMLTQALEIGVTCIAAHCGTGMMALDPDYFDEFAAMTRRYPTLYGDNSALAGLSLRFRPSQMRRIREDDALAARILYGSDLPVPPSGLALAALGMVDGETYLAARRHENPLARDVMLKRALGFPSESETRLATLLRR
jgi:uncharacterized protein